MIVYYSCVVDDSAKFYWQGYIFINTLINLANVKGERIFVHLIKHNAEFENFLKEKSINIKYIEPWGDKKYCNKLQQLETKELQNADYVFFCDSDIAITEDLVNIEKINTDKVLGKIVDYNIPEIKVLKQIYDLFQVDYPNLSSYTLNNAQTFEGNFNGGLYGIPSKHIKKFSQSWKYFAKEMLNSSKIAELLKDKIDHIDQISFSLALKYLNLKYETLSYEYNCPTHIQNVEVLEGKLESDVKVIHYHSSISTIGLLENIDNRYIFNVIEKINNILKNNFNNVLFWNYRYSTNPQLGSGIGSRGDIAEYKLRLLKNLGVEAELSVLDVGCGDLEIIKNLTIKDYTGVDISYQAIERAKYKFPQHKFYIYDHKDFRIEESDCVICLDVLIHQTSRESYNELLEFIIKKTKKRLIVSGYETKSDSSHMCFYYENIKSSLEKTGVFKYVYKVGIYRGLGVYIADKGTLSEQKTLNDINNSVIDKALNIDIINKNLLLESIRFSRVHFKWFTKHYPRLYEYPWLLEKIGDELKGTNIADFGSGVTPLPLQLAQRGANVYTVDNHEMKRELSCIADANEWGFFDYSTIDNRIKSFNESLDINTFEENSLDIWYSISVIEHMPAKIRKDIFISMVSSLKNKGKIFLTIDLVKNTEDLWNMSEGKIVEDRSIHGSLQTFIDELKNLGFDIHEQKIYSMPNDERVDIAMISATLTKGKMT